MRWAWSSLVLSVLLLGTAVAQIAVPPFEGLVIDQTGTLTAEQRAALDQKLTAFQARKGSQIAVLIVSTLAGEDAASFGIRVADAWKPGRKSSDDGAILIVAMQDRRVRIEVGYGLEGVLTDAVSRRVIDETLAPHFKVGDYAGGLDAGVDQIIRLVDGEPLPEPQRNWSRSAPLGDLLPVLFGIVFFASVFLRRLIGRLGGSLATAGIAGAVTWFITHLLPWTILAGIGALVLALIVGSGGGPRGWSSHQRGGRRGGWGGGFGGGGFGGGGFGGGGFGGGGGGGFGGGGASGGW